MSASPDAETGPTPCPVSGRYVPWAAMADFDIPFNRPCADKAELAYMNDALAGRHIAGPGIYSAQCEQFLENTIGVKQALLTPSCSHALEMCAYLLNIGPGDEFIVPSFAFVTTAAAFANRGATPVFWDSRRDTLNGDECLLEPLITDRTKAIIVLHYAGVGCDMNAIMQIADRRGVPVVEDNAHGLFGKYRDRYLGAFGTVAAQSFHETKNFTCGEGGAIMVNDETLRGRAEIIRDKGTNRAAMYRGDADKYTWVDYGSSYVQSDLLAAFLLGQLERHDRIQSTRARIWNAYQDRLSSWAKAGGIEQPVIPRECDHAHHLYHLVFPTSGARDAFIKHMREKKILTVFHYLALNISPMGQKLGGKPGSCPVAEDISTRLVRLPMFNDMDDATLDRIVEAATAYNV